jgi:phage tail protein X
MSLEIPFTNLSYEYIALPEGYPVQPYNDQALQAAVYTASKGRSGYVTVLLPLTGNLAVTLPDMLEAEEAVYHFAIGLKHDESLDDKGRLAMISMAVEFPDVVAKEGLWDVVVAWEDKARNVVMYTNMLPVL